VRAFSTSLSVLTAAAAAVHLTVFLWTGSLFCGADEDDFAFSPNFWMEGGVASDGAVLLWGLALISLTVDATSKRTERGVIVAGLAIAVAIAAPFAAIALYSRCGGTLW
jgi:hypothetical protein